MVVEYAWYNVASDGAPSVQGLEAEAVSLLNTFVVIFKTHLGFVLETCFHFLFVICLDIFGTFLLLFRNNV